ncbi:MAG: 4'-phosphopantetheinyl transferase superfamily protein [Pseudomonadota bacterium]
MIADNLVMEPYRSQSALEFFASAAVLTHLCTDISRVRCASTAIADYSAELFPEERALVERAVPKRRREFSTGRWLAHRLLTETGRAQAPVLRRGARAPLWPEASVGSIAHTEHLGWVAIAEANAKIAGLGIDVELRRRLPENLFDKLFLPGELDLIATLGPEIPTALFAAKEAIYKATEPLAGAFIGFSEAVLSLTDKPYSGQGSLAFHFRARYLGEHAPSARLEQGEGLVQLVGDHVFALFVIGER